MNDPLRCYCQLGDLSSAAVSLATTRRHLHQHPELSFQEADTAALVAESLEQCGWQVTRGVGGHGVVATLREGSGGRSIALRADMDALPIDEATGKAWASRTPGVMHACGHDGHTAMLLGAAQHLAKTRDFSGTVHLVFQPAEEAGQGSGAQRMIEDGLFERFHCDAIFGLHNTPGVPAGSFGFASGPFMAASDTARITIHGRGGHAARPHQAVDPILIAGSLVVALQSVVARNVDPRQMAIVTIGALHAGSAPNVIPDVATMALSIRSFDAEVRHLLEQRIRALVTAHVQGYGGEVTIDYERGYPVVVNSPAETEFARRVAEELVGPAKVIAPFPQVTGSEDFAYYLERKPGCFLRLGNGEGGAMLHNPKYDFNDEILTVGAEYWTRLAQRYLAEGVAPGVAGA
jgi:hippurate hydrolase